MVNPVNLIDLLSDIANLLEGLRVEDVALLDLEAQAYDVRATESAAEMVVGFDIRMGLRQQVRKLAVHLNLGGIVGEENRHYAQQAKRNPAILNCVAGDSTRDPVSKWQGGQFRCRQTFALSKCHWFCPDRMLRDASVSPSLHAANCKVLPHPLQQLRVEHRPGRAAVMGQEARPFSTSN